MRNVLILLLLTCYSCSTTSKPSHPQLGKIIESTYQVKNFKPDESGFNMQLVLRGAPKGLELDSLSFRGLIAKSLKSENKGNTLRVQTYIPLVSRKLKGFRKDRTTADDGIFFRMNGNSYFHRIKFKNKL